MQVWNVLHLACWKYRTQKIGHLCTITQLCRAVSLQLRQVSTIRKKLVKQQYLLHMFSRNSFTSRLHYCSDVAQRSQPNFARCLAISCAGSLYIHFRGLLPPNGILPGAKFTLLQILHFPILAVLLHSTRAVGISQTVWHSAEGANCIRQGGRHVEHRPTF